ncbi:MAG: choline-sulfatase [Rhodobiaceae bacterium]
MTGQPNILLIMADQLAAQALSLYGNRICKTPNLERLACEGVTFANNYSNNPLCVPSRASMMTGRHSPEIRVYDNANEIPSSLPTMAHFMRALGYQTFLSGKMHFIGPDQLHGFEERLTTDVYPADYQWIADWSAGPAFVPSGTALNGVVEAGPCVRTMQEDYDDDVEFQARRKIFDLARQDGARQDGARQDGTKPFFGVVSFTSPHTPFNVAQQYWDLYDHDDIGLPDVPAIPFAELDYFSKALFFAHGRHRHTVTEEHLRKTRHAYFAMISYIDEKIGKLLDQLEETGLRDDTVVIFTSDHGEMLGERGMWFKQCFWEWSARVPLIVSAPNGRRGARVEATTSLVDLAPTLIEMGGGAAKLPEQMGAELAGNAITALLDGEDGDWPDIAVSDYLAIGPCVPCRMVRKGQYKYIFTHGQPDLLFNLVSDPDELRNLAEEPAHATILGELRRIAMQDYDPEALMSEVIASQRRRRFIATVPGTNPPWDYVAYQGDADRYVRRDGVDGTKSRLRLPRIAPVAPDMPELTAETINRMMRGEMDFPA